MTKIRSLIFLLTLILVGTVGTFIFYYARGYRFDIDSFRFIPNGLLVVKSNPDGAQVYINGELKTATNTNLFISPGTYDVSIRKEGYLPWYKRLTVKKEIVTEANASLFRAVPSLSAVTFNSSFNPVPSSDFAKIAYIVPPSTQDLNSDQNKLGLWVLETVNLPLGFSKDPKKITDGDLSNASWEWSPNGREIMLTTKTGVFLLDAGSFTPQNQRVNIASTKIDVLKRWEKERETKFAAQLRGLPDELIEILERRASSVLFSPDEKMILYTASSSAVLAENLIKPIPGASTQKQERNIKENQTYVYDIKEDRNFLIDEASESLVIGNQLHDISNRRLAWFPTSRHLVLAEESKVIIMDYDGTNRQEVYSGSYIAPHAFPTVSAERLLLLTNLGADNVLPNLYSLTLK
ncbi:MAG: PEGA domain-containing protein [Microgenomates group bacterium]